MVVSDSLSSLVLLTQVKSMPGWLSMVLIKQNRYINFTRFLNRINIINLPIFMNYFPFLFYIQVKYQLALLMFNIDQIIENRQTMNQSTHIAMEIIAEESSRIGSQNHLKDTEAPSLQLLMKAHHRIRTLQIQNEELSNQIAKIGQEQGRVHQLQRQVMRLNDLLQDRDLKIQNLERINQKAIMDYILLQKEFNDIQAQTRKCKKNNVTPIPSQLNSPLNLTKINRRSQEDAEESIVFENEKVNIDHAKNYLISQQKLLLNRRQSKQKNFELFTFDKQNFQRSYKSPSNKPVLKNCFSQLQINNLIKKVNHRQTHKGNCDNKDRIKHYHNYCSSVQKKYSPNTALKKTFHFPKSPPLHLKNPYLTNKPFLSFNEKTWNETSTTNGTTSCFGNIHDHSYKKLTFY